MAKPDAYETLLLDVLTGDQTLFVHGPLALALRDGMAVRESEGADAAQEDLRREGR